MMPSRLEWETQVSEPSVGRCGDACDALAETIIGHFETGAIHRAGAWRSFDDVEYAP